MVPLLEGSSSTVVFIVGVSETNLLRSAHDLNPYPHPAAFFSARPVPTLFWFRSPTCCFPFPEDQGIPLLSYFALSRTRSSHGQHCLPRLSLLLILHIFQVEEIKKKQ